MTKTWASLLQPAPLPDYFYQALPSDQHIRILTLQPSAAKNAPLTGTLETISLEDPSFNYCAISYVWGSPADRAQFTCDGGRLTITQSLADGLSRMRKPNEPVRLWADQVCINQQDLAERSKQVKLMNQIYRNAAQVLVWLGRDDEGVASRAFSKIRYLNTVFSNKSQYERFLKAYSEDLDKQPRASWAPLTKLTQLPWFHRIWIVQEIGTPSTALLRWGESEIDWEMLSFVVGVLNEKFHRLRMRNHIGTPNIRYLYKRFIEPEEDFDESHNRGSFIYELHRARHMLAEDPRDHVYAFLGHFSLQIATPALKSLVADYSRSVEDIFCDVAARSLIGASNLLLLSTVRNVESKDGTVARPLPSWVPDWRLGPHHIAGSPQTHHLAAGDTKPDLWIDQEQYILHIKGLQVDTITTCSFEMFGSAFNFPRSDVEVQVTAVEKLWTSICKFDLPITLDRQYHQSSDSAFFAMAQTLSNACHGMDRQRKYISIHPDEWMSHAAAYIVRASGQESTSIGLDILTLNEKSPGDAFKWGHEATLVSRHKRFAITSNGYFVSGPKALQEGDIVVILYGGKTPFILRPRTEDVRGGWYILGECYVHGLMSGEVFTKKDLIEEEFSIY